LRPIAALGSAVALFVILAGFAPWVVSSHFDGGLTPSDVVLLALFIAAVIGLLVAFWKPRLGGALTLIAVGLHWGGMMLFWSPPFVGYFYGWCAVPAVLNLMVPRRA
jgi:hypothetical protein